MKLSPGFVVPVRKEGSFPQDANPTSEELDIPAEWLAEFEAAARRPLEQRSRHAFIKTYKPVMNDASNRSFETMAAYRRWCEANLPSWLGYGRV